MTVEVLREIEIIIIILFGGLSILLGWNLFRVGIILPQSGEIETGAWKISLKSVGPGVFFALFGAAVLSFSLNTQLETKDKTKNGEYRHAYRDQTDALSVIEKQNDLMAVQSINYLSNSLAINRLYDIADNANFKTTDINGVKYAIENLKTYRDISIIIKKYIRDNGVIRDYEGYKNDKSIEIKDPARKARLEEYIKWKEATLR